MSRRRLTVDITDLPTLATAVVLNDSESLRSLALLRHGHPRAASYHTSGSASTQPASNGDDPEAQTPPPAYSDRTGEIAYTVDHGIVLGRQYRNLKNRALTALLDLEKFQVAVTTAAPLTDALPRSDEMWCANHLQYNRFEPKSPGRDGLCGWCWGVRQDPAYQVAPTLAAIELRENLTRIPRDRLDHAMKPAPTSKTLTRTKKWRKRHR